MANNLGMAFANRIERNSSLTTPIVDLPGYAAPSDDPLCDETDAAEDNYDGIDWNRLPNPQKPSQTSKKKASWIYKYGYRCQNRKNPDLIIWVCLVLLSTQDHRKGSVQCHQCDQRCCQSFETTNSRSWIQRE